MTHRIFIPYNEPQIIFDNEDISLDCLQTIIKTSDICMHILQPAEEGQLKTISNLYKKPVVIRCGFDIELEKGDVILLIFELNKYRSKWHLISNLEFLKKSLSVPKLLRQSTINSRAKINKKRVIKK